jgi:hypothetical protein
VKVRRQCPSSAVSPGGAKALELLLFEQQYKYPQSISGDNYLSQTVLTHDGYN